ncbi:MAG: hypothetical protein K2V38_05970, partial [Gemmataceae bacterium]|nr:hypothetical protein [Gemmataceae bacterium]
MQVLDFPQTVMRSWPTTLAFSPDGRYLAVAMSYTQILDTAAGRWVAPMASHDQSLVQFALGGRALAHLDYVTGV